MASLFAGCDLLIEERGYSKLRGDPGAISDYDLEDYVPIPVAGETPTGRSPEGDSKGGLNIKAEWYIYNDSAEPASYTLLGDGFKFAEGDVYFAKITLRLEEGRYWYDGANHILSYAKDKVTACTGGALDNEDSRERAVEVLYKAAERGGGNVPVITVYDLQHYVPIPVTDAVPVTSVTRPDLTVAVQWAAEEMDIGDPPEPFVQGVVYTAEITLTAANPYTFDKDISFYYTTAAVSALSPPDDKDTKIRHLTVTCHPTAASAAITYVDLSNLLPAPATGADPVGGFPAGTFDGTVEWYISDEPKSEGEFAPGTVYTAAVTLEPATGYAFADAVTVTHTGAPPTSFPFTEKNDNPQARRGDITFPETAGGETPVDDRYLNLTDYLPAPEEGQDPAKAFDNPSFAQDTADYTVENVSWAPRHGIFLAGTAYTATVTLKAGTDKTFDGTDTRFFHAEGNISVQSNSGGTVTLTIGFRQISPAPDIGETWYVHRNGYDNRKGTDRTKSLATIKEALSRAELTNNTSWRPGASAEIVLLSPIMVSLNDIDTLIPSIKRLLASAHHPAQRHPIRAVDARHTEEGGGW
jgi:hypothetical protein